MPEIIDFKSPSANWDGDPDLMLFIAFAAARQEAQRLVGEQLLQAVADGIKGGA